MPVLRFSCQLSDSVAKTGNYPCVWSFFPFPRTKVILKWGWFLLELFEGGDRMGATLRRTPADCGLLNGTDTWANMGRGCTW